MGIHKATCRVGKIVRSDPLSQRRHVWPSSYHELYLKYRHISGYIHSELDKLPHDRVAIETQSAGSDRMCLDLEREAKPNIKRGVNGSDKLHSNSNSDDMLRNKS